jgi:hypothetical protein
MKGRHGSPRAAMPSKMCEVEHEPAKHGTVFLRPADESCSTSFDYLFSSYKNLSFTSSEQWSGGKLDRVLMGLALGPSTAP